MGPNRGTVFGKGRERDHFSSALGTTTGTGVRTTMPLAKIRVAAPESIIAYFIIFAASFVTSTDPFAMGIVIEDIVETDHDGSITQQKNKIDLRQNPSHESA